jgi:DNA-binding transcriptional ArsR family regulator
MGGGHAIRHPTKTEAALTTLQRPRTIRQLSRTLDMSLDASMRLLARLRRRGVVHCLNPQARRSRVYVRAGAQLPRDVDWVLYGWVSYSQRRAVLEALDVPRYPAAIKRRARYLHPGIRLSANNVRDIIRLFRERGIVTPLDVSGRAHPSYALTPHGAVLQRLILESEAARP